MEKTLYLLTGPTAVGKTELALQWAEENDAEILSCDSLLVYKGMDIGTAKPSREELERVRHHGIDLVSVRERYSIKDYVDMAVEVVESIGSRGKRVLVVGGSGFYLKSFVAPVVDDIAVAEDVKRYVESLYEKEGLGGLVVALKGLSPEGVGELDLENLRRVMRGLERCLASGKGLVELKEEFEAQGTPFDGFEKRVCLLQRDPEVLRKRVEERVKVMLIGGLIEEVEQLRAEGIEENPSAAGAIGYREVLAFLEAEGRDLEVLEKEIVKNTMGLVAKQRKWFRNQVEVDRVVNLGEDNDVLGCCRLLF